MPDESNRVTSDAAHPRGLLEELERAVEALREHPTLCAASRQLSEGIDKETLDSMKRFMEQQLKPLVELLKPLAELQKIVDDLDPHMLKEKEFKELWPKTPKEIIQGALESGRLRERRILLQAKEAETNRRLALIAFFAALATLLAVPFVERFVKWLLP